MSANIKGFRELDEFGTGHIGPLDEDGTCKRIRGERRVEDDHALPLLENLNLQVVTLAWYEGTSTDTCIWMPEGQSDISKFFTIRHVQVYYWPEANFEPSALARESLPSSKCKWNAFYHDSSGPLYDA